MKKLFEKPVVLLGTLGALVGLGFVSSQSTEVKAQGSVPWCTWIDAPSYPDIDGCKIPMISFPCICEEGC